VTPRALRRQDGLIWITAPISAAVLAVAAASLVANAGRVSAAAFAGSVAALAVATVAIGFLFSRWCRDDRAALLAFLAAGAAGSVLAALLPASPAFVIAFLALVGLGMSELPVWPYVAAAVVFAAMNIALLFNSGWSVTSVISEDIGALFIFTIGLFIRSARISREQAHAARARAEELLAQLAASQEAQAQAAALTERARLAREIHDVLAHALSGLVLALDTMELLARQGGDDPGTVERMLEQVSRAQRIAREGLADTRRAIAALRGDELPGAPLLPQLVQAAAATGIHASLTVTGDPRPLPPETGLALYRTAQEALTNTAKYAGRAATACVELTYRPGSVELLVQDTPADKAADGPANGASPADWPGDNLTFGGYGLTGMRERAELLGGTLTAGPAGSGFAVRLQLPVPPADPANPTPLNPASQTGPADPASPADPDGPASLAAPATPSSATNVASSPGPAEADSPVYPTNLLRPEGSASHTGPAGAGDRAWTGRAMPRRNGGSA
jgi:signal transduction histidine kinase